MKEVSFLDIYLKYYCEKQGITLEELAEKLGVSKKFLIRAEKGTKLISLDMASEMADILHISLDNLARRNFTRTCFHSHADMERGSKEKKWTSDIQEVLKLCHGYSSEKWFILDIEQRENGEIYYLLGRATGKRKKSTINLIFPIKHIFEDEKDSEEDEERR